jgi:hypothetical protein
MYAMIVTVSLGKAVAAVTGAAVAAGVLGYAFRGKEKQALSGLANDIKKKI